MSGPDFTPGPWAHSNEGCRIGSAYGPDGTLVAQAVGDSAEAEANGYLIAAAPDLYVVADHPVLEWLCTDGLQSIPEPQRTSVRLFLVPARAAALARAKGEVAP